MTLKCATLLGHQGKSTSYVQSTGFWVMYHQISTILHVKLATEKEVSAEFSRITTIPLLSKFMGQLDHFSSQLLKNFKKKGGAAAQKITDILSVLDQSITIEKKRECILKALVVYLNEDPSNLVKEYMDAEHDEAQILMSNTTLGICTIKHEGADVADPYEDVGVIIEGIQVLDNLDNVANACSMMN
nr:uncharacterized protein LOC111841794 isoform X2 [Paramormyrops kingsleyae]